MASHRIKEHHPHKEPAIDPFAGVRQDGWVAWRYLPGAWTALTRTAYPKGKPSRVLIVGCLLLLACYGGWLVWPFLAWAGKWFGRLL